MTIVEAIKTVLQDAPDGLSSEEIYDRIVERGLYVFGAKKPVAVVNGEIRRRCRGLDFPTAFPIKQFEILSYRGKKPLFGLLHNKEAISAIKEKNKTISPQSPLMQSKLCGCADEAGSCIDARASKNRRFAKWCGSFNFIHAIYTPV